MRRARRLTSEDLAKWIRHFYWLQLVILLASFIILFSLTPLGFWPSFCFATMHPLSRMPLFLMGVYAGELRIRCSRGFSLLSVWPNSVGWLFPASCSCVGASRIDFADEEAFWTTRSLRLGLGLLFATHTVAQGNSLAATNILGAVWFQAIVPFGQLEFIVALTLQSTGSWMHRVLTTSLARFFGRISMTIYLIHYSVIFYVEWGISGFRPCPWPAGARRTAQNSQVSASNDDATYLDWVKYRQLPLCAIPVVVLITIPVATFVFFFFEEPVRRFLRSS